MSKNLTYNRTEGVNNNKVKSREEITQEIW